MRLTRRVARLELACLPPPEQPLMSPEAIERANKIIARMLADPPRRAEYIEHIRKCRRERGEDDNIPEDHDFFIHE